MSVLPDRRDAWRLVQVAELLRRSHRMHEQALVELDRIEIASELACDAAVTLSDVATGALEAYGDAIADLATQLRLLTADLPTGTVEIAPGDAAREAAADLASGIFDEARAVLAARVLSVADGWPALADALRSADAHWGWEVTSIAALIGAFRGARDVDVAHVVVDAGVAPDALFALCTPEQIERLAAALEQHGAA